MRRCCRAALDRRLSAEGRAFCLEVEPEGDAGAAENVELWSELSDFWIGRVEKGRDKGRREARKSAAVETRVFQRDGRTRSVVNEK